MANHKSAIKRARQNKVRRVGNMSYKTKVKKAVKELRAAVAGNSVDQAKESFPSTVSIIQKTAGRGVIPRKTAARKISRLARQVNQISSP